VSRQHQIPLRTFLWEYLGHPDDETPERKRILYAIVALRLGFALLFLLRGWSAVFAAPPDAFATRLGDPARFGLSGAAIDTTLFILGCTELGIGALLLFGAFTRVSAVTGMVLATLYLLLGDRSLLDLATSRNPNLPEALRQTALWDERAMVAASLIAALSGLLILVICGSPFLSADRALDKVEEEERDRAPAVLPRLAHATPLVLGIGLTLALWWRLLWGYWSDPERIVVALIGAVVIAISLVLGVAVRPFAAGVILWIVALAISGAFSWHASDWLLPAMPTVAAALVITGPGSNSIGRRILRSKSARSSSNEAHGEAG
jgi:uncharacterized membrane protein YphA (DoxX/SURF4 family)